jgi:hypothetical protein
MMKEEKERSKNDGIGSKSKEEQGRMRSNTLYNHFRRPQTPHFHQMKEECINFSLA